MCTLQTFSWPKKCFLDNIFSVLVCSINKHVNITVQGFASTFQIKIIQSYSSLHFIAKRRKSSEQYMRKLISVRVIWLSFKFGAVLYNLALIHANYNVLALFCNKPGHFMCLFGLLPNFSKMSTARRDSISYDQSHIQFHILQFTKRPY